MLIPPLRTVPSPPILPVPLQPRGSEDLIPSAFRHGSALSLAPLQLFGSSLREVEPYSLPQLEHGPTASQASVLPGRYLHSSRNVKNNKNQNRKLYQGMKICSGVELWWPVRARSARPLPPPAPLRVPSSPRVLVPCVWGTKPPRMPAGVVLSPDVLFGLSSDLFPVDTALPELAGPQHGDLSRVCRPCSGSAAPWQRGSAPEPGGRSRGQQGPHFPSEGIAIPSPHSSQHPNPCTWQTFPPLGGLSKG